MFRKLHKQTTGRLLEFGRRSRCELGELQQQGNRTQIVIVTSFATADDLKHYVESGADAALPKPLDIGTLIGLLSSLRKIKQGKWQNSGLFRRAAAKPIAKENEMLYSSPPPVPGAGCISDGAEVLCPASPLQDRATIAAQATRQVQTNVAFPEKAAGGILGHSRVSRDRRHQKGVRYRICRAPDSDCRRPQRIRSTTEWPR